ncbi:MAG: serine/threonine-protein kinase [Pseudomonadota bacterium]|nr:serine/threonine-protein kinase [Pseudomonadota bacterium]
MNDPAAIERIGKYIVIREIGRGAFATVYLADDPFNQRKVAIKLLDKNDDYKDSESARRRKLFLNEASLAGKLVHPNIVKVFDASTESDMSYLVMEYVPGGNLKHYCSEDNLLPIRKVAMLVFKCCRALDYAYQNGVIHRDIKPANILLSEQEDIKISDFGTAHISTTQTTQVQGFLGSPAYMSPEQINEENPSVQSDIYSMGIVLYELLSGRLPFTAQNFPSMLNKILNEPAMSITDYRPDLPDRLVSIVHKAMHKELSIRYPNWYEFSRDLADSLKEWEQIVNELSHAEKVNLLRDLNFFKFFNEEQLKEVVRNADWVSRAKNENVLQEGDIDQAFYVIVKGKVKVTKGGRMLNALKSGDCFGEISFLNPTNQERTTAVTALDDVKILRLHVPQMDLMSESTQLQFNKIFLRNLVSRLSQTSSDADL